MTDRHVKLKLPDYLTQDREGYIHISGHRIGLEDIVYYYNQGYSAKKLACEYATLPLPLVQKVVTFYLENRETVDEYVRQGEQELEAHRRSAKPAPTLLELRKRLDDLPTVESPH